MNNEKTTVSIILNYVEGFVYCADILRPEMFHSIAYRILYESIEKSFFAYNKCDILTVINQLRNDGTLDSIGGPSFVTEVSSFYQVPNASYVVSFAQEVKREWQLRQSSVLGEVLRTRAEDETEDPNKLIPEITLKLIDLAGESTNQTTDLSSEKYQAKHSEELKEKQASIKESGSSGVPSGIECLDRMTLGFQKGELTIVAARPAMGKTAFMCQLSRHAGEKGFPALVFSLEMPVDQINARLLSSLCRVNSQEIHTGNNLDPEKWERIELAKIEMRKIPVIVDDSATMNIIQARAIAMREKVRRNIGIVFVDYLTLMDGIRHKGDNREQEVSSISRGLRAMAKELDIPVVALAQLSRTCETRGGDKKPILSDLRESGQIEQDAHNVIFLYRPEYYGISTYEDGDSTEGVCEAIIAKNRQGPVGVAEMNLKIEYGLFTSHIPKPKSTAQMMGPGLIQSNDYEDFLR